MYFDSYIVSDTKFAKSIILTDISNFDNKKFSLSSLKQKAFTLAEVLITLSIIGVVAAMTVPTLMSNTSNQQHVTALKKAYSTLSNAMKMMPVNLGCGSDYECMMSALPTQTDVHRGNSTSGILSQDEAFLYGLSEQFKAKYNPEWRSWHDSGEIGSFSNGTFTTQDGMVFGLHYISTWYSSGGMSAEMQVDTNGFDKGPNKLGKDQHIFEVVLKEINGIAPGTVVPAGSSQYAQLTNSSTGYWKNASFNQSYNYLYTGKILETGKIDEADFKK